MELVNTNVSPMREVLWMNLSAVMCAVLGRFYKSPWQVINIFTVMAAVWFLYTCFSISQICTSFKVSCCNFTFIHLHIHTIAEQHILASSVFRLLSNLLILNHMDNSVTIQGLPGFKWVI